MKKKVKPQQKAATQKKAPANKPTSQARSRHKVSAAPKKSAAKKKAPSTVSSGATQPKPADTKSKLQPQEPRLEPKSPPDTESITSYIPEVLEGYDDDQRKPAGASGTKTSLPALRQTKSLAVNDPLAAYLREVRKYPLLTPEQEKDIATQYAETGDPKFAEILVTSNLRFVVKIAAEYARVGARMIDLVQEGNMGLLHAVKVYNPYKGVRLITYAVWWIRGYIQEYLMKQYSMVKIGTTQSQRKLFYQLQREQETLEQLGDSGNYKAIADSLGVSEEDVKMMTQRMSGRDVSLNVTPEEGGTSLLELQSDSTLESIDDELAHQEELELLRQNIENIQDDLNEREKFILEQRLLSDQPLTLQEIGDKYGITREAARQMEARLIVKLQKGYQKLIKSENL